MIDIVRDILGSSTVSDDLLVQCCIVLIVLFLVATIDLISQFVYIFTRMK